MHPRIRDRNLKILRQRHAAYSARIADNFDSLNMNVALHIKKLQSFHDQFSGEEILLLLNTWISFQDILADCDCDNANKVVLVTQLSAAMCELTCHTLKNMQAQVTATSCAVLIVPKA